MMRLIIKDMHCMNLRAYDKAVNGCGSILRVLRICCEQKEGSTWSSTPALRSAVQWSSYSCH